MARDEPAQRELTPPEPEQPVSDAPATAEEAAESATVHPVGDVAPVEQSEPTFKVSLASDSDLEAPVAVAVPELLDAEGNARVKVDEDSRLVLDTKPVEVPQIVATALQPLPYAHVEVAY